MHTVEETASLLAARAPFSLFPTSKDDGSQGHFVSLWRRAILSLVGKEEGNFDKFIEDIMAMSIRHTFNKSSLGNSSNVDSLVLVVTLMSWLQYMSFILLHCLNYKTS